MRMDTSLNLAKCGIWSVFPQLVVTDTPCNAFPEVYNTKNMKMVVNEVTVDNLFL